jgi:NifU-like protein
MRYSRKLIQKIEHPRHVGEMTSQDAQERGMRLAVGTAGSLAVQGMVRLFLFVDEMDGVIADVKFQAFGPSSLIGAAEAASELLIRKNYDQALRISADLIDKQVRDKSEIAAFPREAFTHLNLVLEAIEEAAEKCLDIPFAESYVPTPLEPSSHASGKGYPGWKELSDKQKIALIEEVIDKEIRPYIELDAGGIRIVNLIDNRELIIAYEGACTSCHSATGATLNAIQEILRARIDSQLTVVPDLTFLTAGSRSHEHDHSSSC